MIKGLTKEEAERLKKEGKSNANPSNTKSYGKIVFTNVFTLFNILNFVLAFLVILIGEYKQAFFLLLILLNLSIGLIQEIRAKKTVDKLSLISQPKTIVIRDGEQTEIGVSDIVLGDVMILDGGRQVCSDCEILEGACEVNESMLTGESDAVAKTVGDNLLSGSFIVSGQVTAQVVRTGKDNYATRLADHAKDIRPTRAEIPRTLKAIIRFMSFVVVPLGLGIFLKSYLIQKIGLSDSILKMTASTISMIPQGLVALSSVVFGASVLRLGAKKTLCQDLYCVETLARVDTLCLDKTGTITEGKMQLDDIVYIKDADIPLILANLMANLTDNNPTANAIRDFADAKAEWTAVKSVAFSSQRKWSGVNFGDMGTYLLGAPEFVLDKDVLSPHVEKIEEYAKRGERVLCLAQSKNDFGEEHEKPAGIELLGFVLLSDKIRKEAPLTIQYFYEQGVDIKIISGDNPVTVSAIARKAGIQGASEYVDASAIDTEEALNDAAKKYKIFGRVTPEQKLSLIKALKNDGHTVAMTGDGVNDVLALREADCSIAMAEGSDAAKTISHLVLLNNDFSSMPKIVAEGRRTINNLRRTASLFLVKTIYSTLLALFFLFFGQYPFEPMHMTLVGAMTIGTPSVLLSFEAHKDLVKGRFITNILKDSFPGALAIVFGIVLLQIIENFVPMQNSEQFSNISVATIAVAGFGMLFRVCKPITRPYHAFVFFFMLMCFMIAWGAFPSFYNLMPVSDFTREMYVLLVPVAAASLILMFILQRALNKKKRDFILINKILRLDKR